MDFLRFLISKKFLVHLSIALSLVLVVVFGSLWWLRAYTHHGKAYPVPDFRYISVDSAQQICAQKNLRYAIMDSVFVDELPGGTIIDQMPNSGFFVKENRTIYFTINAFEAEKVLMPDLIDLSFRKAKAVLDNLGLLIDGISYEPDLAVNIVLRQLIDSSEVPVDSLIAKGSAIHLVLGEGLSEEKTLVPNLQGLDLDSARSFASHAYLNIGVVIYDTTVVDLEDTIMAKVFEQDPPSDEETTIKLGSAIDLWLTCDSLKYQRDTINSVLSDSLYKSLSNIIE